MSNTTQEGSSRWDVMGYSFQSPSIATITALVVVAVTAAWMLLSYFLSSLAMKRKLKDRPAVPPGSLGIPVVGETIQFVSHFTSNRLDAFWAARQAKYGPTLKIGYLGNPTVILEPPAGNKFIFANEGKLLENSWPESVKELLGPDSLSLKKGEDFVNYRRHIGGLLSPEAVSKYLPRVEQNALDHLAEFWQPPTGSGEGDQFPVSMFKVVKVFTFKLVADFCLSLRGGPELDQLEHWFFVWGNGMFQLPVNLPGFAYHRARKARLSIMQWMGGVIARRRAELEDGTASATQDILSCLVSQPDETGRLNTDEEIKDNILLLLFAGHDTSSSVLSMTVMSIARHPEIRQNILQEQNAIAARKKEGEGLMPEDLREMKYTWRVVQETMRLMPAVVGAYKEAVTDFEYNGYTILKGWQLHWTNQTSHLNPKFFKDPKKFDPSRFESMTDLVPYTYMPFGGGPRLCPGNAFAKMEMLVFIYHLVRKYTWTLADPNEPIMRSPMPTTAKGVPIIVTKL